MQRQGAFQKYTNGTQNRGVRKAVAKLVAEVHKKHPKSRCTEGSGQTCCRSTQKAATQNCHNDLQKAATQIFHQKNLPHRPVTKVSHHKTATLPQIDFWGIFSQRSLWQICVALDACGCSVWQLFGGKANLPQINVAVDLCGRFPRMGARSAFGALIITLRWRLWRRVMLVSWGGASGAA